MKKRDTLLLEAAYSKMYNALTPDGPEANKPGQYNALTPDGPKKGTGVTEEAAAKYYAMMKKLENNKISEQQWQDFCMVLLGDIMEANKDLFVHLKNIGTNKKELPELEGVF